AAVTMIGSLGTAFSHSFASLLGYRALAGLGMIEEAVVLSLAADLFPPDQRGRANILIVIGEYAGSALGYGLAGWLLMLAGAVPSSGELGSWRAVQLLFGALGLLAALPLLWLREPDRHEMSAAAAADLSASWSMLRRLGPFLWPMLVAQVAMITVNN